MLRDYISLTLGVLTLLIASGAVYGILTINTQIQAKPETTIPDYSNELGSLKSQVNSMNSQINSMHSQLSSMGANLSTLDSMKNSLTDVSAKLLVLEKNTNQVSSTSTPPSNSLLTVMLDKPVYLQGDTVNIAAVGAIPLKAIQVELVDSAGYVVTSSQTYADSAGKVSYSLKIPSSQLSGSYQVKLVSDQQTSSTPLIIQSGTSSSSSASTFTAQTDKAIYSTNDMVQVSGKGTPNTSVTGVFTSASGYTATSITTVNGDGSFVMLFDILPSYQTGTWTITLTNGVQTKSLSMYIVSGSSSSSYTFTAQTSKSTYNSGDTIQISGIGSPNTSVTGVLTSPTGRTYNSGATISSDGTYVVYFTNLQYYETGTWTVNMNDVGQSKSITFYMQSASSTFTAQTSKSTYNSGDTIQISGTGTPNTAVTGVLTSPTGRTYNSGATVSTGGSYAVYFTNLQYYETGTWTANMNNAGQSKSITFYMQSASSTFTAQTSQSTYTRGAVIQVTGTGQPNTIVNEVLTSPSGSTYNASSTVQSDGTYSVFFQTSTSYQTGSWTVSVSNSGQSQTLHVLLQ